MRLFTSFFWKTACLISLILFLISCPIDAQDWHSYYQFTNFEKYQKANSELDELKEGENRVVFMGNSITEAWPVLSPNFFKDKSYIGRGISGQTTPQMLLRFRKDVINLQPKVVVILAGTNDLAQNTGFTPTELILENIISMSELATHHGIEVILCSVLPAVDFPWKTGLKPVSKIIELNGMIKNYAETYGHLYVDYHSALKDENNGLKVPEYTTAGDLVHPNAAGYKVMEELVTPAIEKALAANSLTVAPLFSDHVVLQQNEEVAIWGTALPNTEVTVKGTWGQSAITTSNTDGSWQLRLSTPSAGGAYMMTVSTPEQSIEIMDVMIGEVWLASGQSNMQMPLKGWPPSDPIKDAEQEIANADFPKLRMFTVERNYSLQRETSLKGKWDVCTPENAGEFSATAYFFARRLQMELGIPIGIIHSSWGGTPAEAWTSRERIKSLGDFNEMMAAMDDPKREQVTNGWFGQWEKRPFPKDAQSWNEIELGDDYIASPDFEERNWATINLPSRLDIFNDKDFNGAFWFRKTVELEDVSSDYTFVMGVVDDTDVVFVNGKKIGGTAYDFANARNYTVPKSYLKKGKNIIAMRIIDTGGPGSIKDELKLTNEKGVDISLKGQWDHLMTAEFFKNEIYVYDLNRVDLSKRPDIVYPSPYSTPSVLYNAMIHPLVPYTLKGAIWYQGEANVGRAEQYRRLFPTMIKDWRSQWQSDFPFYFVQIAPFRYNGGSDSSEDVSQKLRDAQRHTLSLEKTGMAVTLDIGNYTNIHPANKQDVGARLAGLALANDYGKNMEASGPLYNSHRVKGNKMTLEFDHIGGGLTIKGDQLSGFEIAGADKNFIPAEAVIKKDKVCLSSKKITKPKYARYAWSDEGLGNLMNEEGLPASSFITEDFQ